MPCKRGKIGQAIVEKGGDGSRLDLDLKRLIFYVNLILNLVSIEEIHVL